MQYVDYIEIENFKGFGPKIRVPLDSPSVLIGPNNSGKTTVLLAFKGDESMVASYHEVPPAVRVSLLQRVKMSKFAEDFFRRLAEETRTPILLNKGQFCQLIAGLKIEEVPAEVIKRLDCVQKMLFREVDALKLTSADARDARPYPVGPKSAGSCVSRDRDDGVSRGGDGVNDGQHGENKPLALHDDGVNALSDGVNALDEGIKALIGAISQSPGKRANELAIMIGKSVPTIERYVRILKERGRIEFRGAPKTGGYYVL